MASQNKTSQARSRTLEREAKAFQLRKKGASYTDIARSLRISRQGAHKLVTAVFEQLESELSETVPTVRRMEIERLDEMLFRNLAQGQEGRLAVNRSRAENIRAPLQNPMRNRHANRARSQRPGWWPNVDRTPRQVRGGRSVRTAPPNQRERVEFRIVCLVGA